MLGRGAWLHASPDIEYTPQVTWKCQAKPPDARFPVLLLSDDGLHEQLCHPSCTAQDLLLLQQKASGHPQQELAGTMSVYEHWTFDEPQYVSGQHRRTGLVCASATGRSSELAHCLPLARSCCTHRTSLPFLDVHFRTIPSCCCCLPRMGIGHACTFRFMSLVRCGASVLMASRDEISQPLVI